MIKENFNPVYNNVEQVKACAAYMLGEKVTDAKIAVVIGHNGRSFVSSTDWRLTTESGAHRILPFSMRPQYPNFLECVAGVKYDLKNGQLRVIPDNKKKAKNAIVEICGKFYSFKAGDALKVYVETDVPFVATDCAVSCLESHDFRLFRVITTQQTAYGLSDKNGRISLAEH